MNRTRRIGLAAYVMLTVLGTGFALENAFSNSHPQSADAVDEPVDPFDAVVTPASPESLDVRPASSDSDDRSDLVLSQG